MILFSHGFEIILPLYILPEITEPSGNLIIKIRLSLRVIQVKFPLQHPNLKQKGILCVIDALLKRLLPQILDKFIRVFVRRHIDNSARHARIPENLYRAQRRLHTGFVAVVCQQDLSGIFLDQSCLPRRERCSQRRHRLREARLMHTDHIHITLTQYHIPSPCRARIIHAI